jgi:hypothetical protein
MTITSAGEFRDLCRVPDLVRAFGADGEIALQPSAGGVWAGGGVVVGFLPDAGRLAVRLRAAVPVARLQLRWQAEQDAGTRYLGDHWERSYGDLEWRGESPERVMPWYFLAHSAGRTHGYGVRVAPSALCFWTAQRLVRRLRSEQLPAGPARVRADLAAVPGRREPAVLGDRRRLVPGRTGDGPVVRQRPVR